jgi:hypothetical protein
MHPFALIATTYMPPHGVVDAGITMSNTTPNIYRIRHLTTPEDEKSDNRTRNNELRCVYVRHYRQTPVAGQQSKQKCHGVVWYGMGNVGSQTSYARRGGMHKEFEFSFS